MFLVKMRISNCIKTVRIYYKIKIFKFKEYRTKINACESISHEFSVWWFVFFSMTSSLCHFYLSTKCWILANLRLLYNGLIQSIQFKHKQKRISIKSGSILLLRISCEVWSLHRYEPERTAMNYFSYVQLSLIKLILAARKQLLVCKPKSFTFF